MQLIKNFINGAFVDGVAGKTFDKRSPVDNRLIARVSEAGKADVDAAVRAAVDRGVPRMPHAKASGAVWRPINAWTCSTAWPMKLRAGSRTSSMRKWPIPVSHATS